RWKYNAAGSEQFDLRCASPQFLARRLAHLVDPVGNDRHDREWTGMAAWVVDFIGRAKIRTAARLGQRPPRVKESRANDLARRQQPGRGVTRPTRLSDRRKAVH